MSSKRTSKLVKGIAPHVHIVWIPINFESLYLSIWDILLLIANNYLWFFCLLRLGKAFDWRIDNVKGELEGVIKHARY